MALTKKHMQRQYYYPHRLQEIFDGIGSYPLTIVESPMGYGKTTLTREWLDRSGYCHVWKRIYDNPIEDQWDDFFTVFTEAIGSTGDKLKDYGFQESTRFARKIAGFFRDLEIPNKLIVVLDDYHLLKSDAVDELIELVAEEEITNLHVVLTLRSQHFDRLEELILKGQLYHITKDDLAFSPGEIVQYYRECEIRLSSKEADILSKNTEGWISAVYMSMLEYAKYGCFTPSTSIYRLLEKSIYRPLSEEMKAFLQYLCAVESFTHAQAQYLWQKDNAKDLLGELMANNMFITYDPVSGTYNMHSIFSGFLQKVLEEECPSCSHEIYRRSGHWYIIQEKYYTARQFFHRCGDYASILRTLAMDKSNSYSRHNKEMIQTYMSQCPEEVKRSDYYGMMAYVLHLIAHHDFRSAFDEAKKLRGYILEDDGLEEVERNMFLGELELMYCLTKINDLKAMGAGFKKAWNLMEESTFMKFKTNNWSFASPSVLCLYYRESGKLMEHVEDMNRYIPYYYQLTRGHGSGGEHVFEGEYHFYRGDFENAMICAHKGYVKARAAGEDVEFAALFLKYRVCLISGETEKAKEYLDIIHRTNVPKRIQSSIHISRMCEGYIYAYLGLDGRIPDQLFEDDLPHVQLMFPGKPFYHLICGRRMLNEGRYKELLGTSEYFFRIASMMPNLLGDLYTHIYQAAAYRKLFRDEEAAASLLKALSIAVPDELYMAFAENGDFIEPMLISLQKQGLYREAITRILQLSATYTANKRRMLEQYFEKKKPVLTARELEIAELAASGLSNAAIGKKLYISANTVKKAISSVYGKLSVNNRTLLKQYLMSEKVLEK